MKIIGHKKILEFLARNIDNNRISHSYLFTGISSVGKFKVAREFAQKLICLLGTDITHPDIHIIDQENKIKIGQIRELSRHISLSPHSSKYKVAIINNIEQLGKEAANALLKTLEEPPVNSILILIASNLEEILPTIISRCQIVRFYPIKEQELLKELKQLDITVSENLLRLAAGRPGVILKILKDKDFLAAKINSLDNIKNILSMNMVEKIELAKNMVEKQDIQTVLEDWLLCLREELIYKIDVTRKPLLKSDLSPQQLNNAVKEIINTKQMIKNTNVNNLLAIENLLFCLPSDRPVNETGK